MKHIGKYAGFVLVITFPSLVFAGTNSFGDTVQALVVIEDNSSLLENLSLWSTLIIAFVTSAMVWIGGRKMHGGVLGGVLTLFSVGMTLIFLGFVTQVPWLQNLNPLYLKMTHDTLYIIGYILMGLAASRLLKVIKGE